MRVLSRHDQSGGERFWIAYGPDGVISGHVAAGDISTGREVLEVFETEVAHTTRLNEIEADLSRALAKARAYPTEPYGLLAHHRWQREIGGFRMPTGLNVRTDPATQNKLGNFTGQYLAGNVPAQIAWKTPDGFVQLSRDEVVAIAAAVTAHITLCFALEKSIADDMAELEATGDMDALDGFDPVGAFDAAYETEARAQGIIA